MLGTLSALTKGGVGIGGTGKEVEMKRRRKRRYRLVEALQEEVSSLKSHLTWMIEKPTRKEKKAKSGSRKFHVRTAKGYARTILTLLKEL